MDQVPPPSTFDRARRKRIVQKLAQTVRNEDTQELLPLGEVTRRLRVFEQSYAGIRPIPIDRIVGTVDRSHEFDRGFLPRRSDMEDRWKRVERSFPGSDFPPIKVYEVDGKYFLIDGHHRVAVARQRGVVQIDAEITLLRTRFPLPADADISRIIHSEQQGLFMDASGLARSRPDARIEFSRPQGYAELLDLVKVHGYNLMQERGQLLSPDEVATDWYDHVYLPVTKVVRREELQSLTPDATEGDLYLRVHQHGLSLVPEHGQLGIPDMVRAVKDAERDRRRRLRRADPPSAGKSRLR